jgi:hypothetical protein
MRRDLQSRLGLGKRRGAELGTGLEDVQALLARIT